MIKKVQLASLPQGSRFRDNAGRVWAKGIPLSIDRNHAPGGQPIFSQPTFLCAKVGSKSGTSGMDAWYADALVEPVDDD